MPLSPKKILIIFVSLTLFLTATDLSQQEIQCDKTLNLCLEKCDANSDNEEACIEACDEAYDKCMPKVDFDDIEVDQEA